VEPINKLEKSWIIYDVANSAFVLVVITTIMPIFFKEYVSGTMAPTVSTANWAFANSIAALFLALSAPILGTLADYQGFKKRFFLVFFVLGIASTFMLATIQPGAWLYCLIIFVVAKIGFAGANLFYDAFLPDVTSKERMDHISSHGFAWGYIGSVIPFLLVMALILMGMKKNGTGALPPVQAKIGFIIVGVWWLLFAIPFIRNVKQSHYLPSSSQPIIDSIKRLLGTFRELRRYRQPFLFLIAYFFYIDGVDTIIIMATSYGVEIGLSSTMLILAILMIQIVAFPCALLYGKMAGKFNAQVMLLAGIGVYIIITYLAFLLPSFASLAAKTYLFWVLAFLVATSMGGIQALSRSYFGKIIPAERSAEFFGFYNICGKFAAIMGPLMMGVVGRITGQTKYGVLSILLLLIIGGILLTQVKATGD